MEICEQMIYPADQEYSISQDLVVVVHFEEGSHHHHHTLEVGSGDHIDKTLKYQGMTQSLIDSPGEP